MTDFMAYDTAFVKFLVAARARGFLVKLIGDLFNNACQVCEGKLYKSRILCHKICQKERLNFAPETAANTLEPISKMRLGVQCCVAGRLKMLTEESVLKLKVS